MSWFELVGAFSDNLHTVASIMFLVSIVLTIGTGLGATLSSQEYNEIEFISLSKGFAKLTILMAVLMCAPTPSMMQSFSTEIDSLNKPSSPKSTIEAKSEKAAPK